ncbi:FecR family protein [Flexithrix dorotheae]|uniref:FecR family protein n=1 Tax=Flexithrix dorotheae TaxID=70993 RepID=UPI00035D64DE|nr:FecR family protein [Flexithrix dorotheae]
MENFSSKNDFIKKMLEGKIPDQTPESDHQSEEFQSIKNIIEKTQNLDVPKGKTKEEAWNNVLNRIDQEKAEPKVVAFQSSKFLVRIAASILLLMVLGISAFFANRQHEEAPFGQSLSLTLPDNSQITLNAGSHITYYKWNWENNREIILEGEAFFEVEKGKEFTVKTPNGNIAVLGTSFNVRNWDKKLEVSCFTGKVKVFNNNSYVFLTKGEATILNQNNEFNAPEKFSEVVISSWRKGEFNYENQPLGFILDEIERKFNTEIEPINMANFIDRKITFSAKGENMSDVLEILSATMDLEYSIENNLVKIQPKP